MYYVLQTFCNENTQIWQNDKPFNRSYKEFVAQLPLIEQYRNTQTQNTSGLAKNKSNKREELINQAYFVANRLQSYSTVEKNNELLGKVNYPRSIFTQYRDTNLIGLCNAVLEQAQIHLTALEEYKVKAETLSNLQNAIQAYQDDLGKPRSAQTSVKVATDALKKLFLDTNALLTSRLDKDVEVFRVSNPDFYQQYLNARRIVQSATVKLSLRVTVIDASTRMPIPNVNARFASYNTTKKTSEKGNFQIKNLAAGDYQMTLEKIGYTTLNHSFSINDRETTKLDLEMMRES
jgi:hypothetical protein